MEIKVIFRKIRSTLPSWFLKIMMYLMRIYLKITKKSCGNYIEINKFNVNELFSKKYIDNSVSIHIFEYKNEIQIKSSKLSIPFDSEKKIDPFRPKSDSIIIDVKNNKEFSFRGNHLLDKNLNVLYESGIDHKTLGIFHEVIPKPVKLKGTIAFLGFTSNYYHWMLLNLPMLRLYEPIISLESIDYFYIGDYSTLKEFQKESLRRIGIPANKIIQFPCIGDRMIYAICNYKSFNNFKIITQDVYEYSKNILNLEKTKVVKKNPYQFIYVKRGNVKARKVKNEEKIIEILKKFGIKPISMDNRSIHEQANLFYNSDIIVAPHGAALTNLLYIRPKTIVLELLPDNYEASYFYAITRYSEGIYFNLKGKKFFGSMMKYRNDRDISIDPLVLERTCSFIFQYYENSINNKT